MPRVYTSQGFAVDYCKKCFPSEKVAFKKWGHDGDGDDNRGNCFEHDGDHPSYDDTDYTCEKCKKELTINDNY